MAIATEIIPSTVSNSQTSAAPAQQISTPNLRVPWGLHPLERWIIDALQDRIYEYNPEPTINPTIYGAGPKTAWARVFSTGISKDDKLRNRLGGFILGGPEDFNSSYGFGNDNQVIIGRTSNNVPHTIPSNAPGDLPHRPPPSLTSVESELLSGQNSSFPGAVRKVNVTFKCHNLTQLKYLVPYFFTPRIPLVIEWGWNTYDPVSLLNLTDISALKKAYVDPQHSLKRIEKSNGNYEVAIGQIFDYGYNLNDAGGYDCFVTIQNSNLLIEGRSLDATSEQNKASTQTGVPTVQTQSTPLGDRTDRVQLKGFKEFVFDDMNNFMSEGSARARQALSDMAPSMDSELNARAVRSTARYKEAEAEQEKFTIRIPSNGRVFKPEKNPRAPANEEQQTWMRMDMVVEIINKFFELTMLDSDGNDTGVVINKLNIDNVKISAHPAIKSVSKNILLPNQFAPRFTIKQESAPNNTANQIAANASGRLSGVSIENASYLTLFSAAVNDVIVKNNYTDDFDDLRQAINPTGRSFPVFEQAPYVDPFGVNSAGVHKAGYWGYLSDVFINIEYFRSLVSTYDTLKTLIEALLKGISIGMSEICTLKMIVPDSSNSVYTVIDNSNTPISDAVDSNGLAIIELNAITSAYLKTATLSVKVSSDMAAQMVLQSASNRVVSQQYGQGNNDPKTMPISSTSEGSLLFDIGVQKLNVPSNSSDNNPQSEYARLFLAGSKFYYYSKETQTNRTVTNRRGGTSTQKVSNITNYILYEHDSGLMRSILNNKKDKNATYINNTIMPGTKFEMELLGIGGIRYLSQFKLANVLEQYNYENAVWQVSMIKHKIEDKIWITYIMAEARPLTTTQTEVRVR